jgi:hypothetical protein
LAVLQVKDANYAEARQRRELEAGLRAVRAELGAARLREGELEAQLKAVASNIKVRAAGNTNCELMDVVRLPA